MGTDLMIGLFAWLGTRTSRVRTSASRSAEAAIDKIEAAVRACPSAGTCRSRPGPNSNTFVAFLARAAPELRLDLPPAATGKDYLAGGALLAALVLPLAAAAERPTPEAHAFIVDREDDRQLVVGFAEDLVPGLRIGAIAVCDKARRRLSIVLSFGGFPDGRLVQTAVRAADGTVARFGPVVRGRRDAGFHSPEVTAPADVRRLLDFAFAEGALVSNGHNSVWNRIPEARNAAARRRLGACGGL
ncbi:MAG: DUF3750 domain-containing protein [Rhodospirillaceae bacterium]|nr:DUF3750 domain-containing protein [Rhodospirillaceae bacterium]